MEVLSNRREGLRNLAIIAHVDHGKTTLVDALFRQGGILRQGQQAPERMLDSVDQERERGITILAKVTSVQFGDLKLQLVDTPGHADFGGEVERSLRMVDGVLLLVDAAEGPLPQTRFVLRKALQLELPSVVAINKIDRSDADPARVLDEVYSLYIDLGASDTQIEFPVLYTNARAGTATTSLDEPGTSLQPLVQAIARTIPPPPQRDDEPFCMQVNQLGYDDYVGRLVVGRVIAGTVQANQTVRVAGADRSDHNARIGGAYAFRGLQRVALDIASSGDIVALAGLSDAGIGDTLSAPETTDRLPTIAVDEPTVAMVFQVNDGPLAGRTGKYLTSRHLNERLRKEAYANVAVQMQPTDVPDQIRVLGRGELQLAVLIEAMRREGYELCVRNPEVVTRQGPDGLEEPTEQLVVDVAAEHSGTVTELCSRRRAQLIDQRLEGSRARLELLIPTRGLFGLRSHLLTATRGTAMLHSVFHSWTPWSGPIAQRQNGALVADRAGFATPYALYHLQPRGVLFISAGTEVYPGMIVGEHSRDNDLSVNVCREKKLTNVRAAGRDDHVVLSPPRQMPLERCLEWMRDDEMLEVVPGFIRLRKR